jgi:DNA-binding MarR family transcriptional regulator
MTRPGPRLALLLLGGYRRLVDAATEELAARGYGDVRPSHHYAMQAIDAGADNASDLGRSLAVTKQAALRTISVLVERGWVAREDHPDDGRRMRLRVTDLGHEVTSVGEAIFDDLRRAWEQQLGSRELATLEAQLTALVGDAPVRPETPGWVGRDDT